ncbi:MAG TPA: ATP-binding cassette domain-containing protein [Anaerolineales bacterium]|nr:ATP-binding cassette domain-containing protein [Anaerolineales bacterium]HNA55980.1 ATP-binding cassette domain-containing protein [Anaerolineales bacterium]HNB88337.1 ATP-binding cassette domain-containing protein [Anaerolineales bacterium]HNC90795.1 ATP-binding cassette domain-containing protein [Anaerolineales bacterium]HNF33926.1 ATP-binding cassette domain-containing protein [Anaerolineales bacterium]
MALISLQEVSIGFGGPPLLDKVNLQIEQGEWIGLLGRNGMGKSTLLKLVNDDIAPQSGIIARQQDLRTAYLPQEVPAGITGKVFDIVAGGLDSLKPVPASDEHHWRGQLQVEQVISRMQLDGEARFEILSAGMKRRVMLARGLVRQPELLLLDEPTNHLDIASIDWLETFLKRWGGTLLFVTHDRVFLQKLTSRIVELDRGRLFDWNCDYSTFLERRDAMLSAEAEQNALFDKKLAQEEVWIRKGIEARRTRNEGRVRALKRLREQRKERRERPGKVKMQIQSEARSGKIVIEAENVSYAYDGRTIVKEFTTTIQRGDKIGIIGPNGSGKTTLLRLLLEELTPQTGTVEHGTNIEIGYFDQLRAQLDETKSVLDNVGQGSDNVTINGRSRNLNVYLEDFLFSRDRINAPISALSGGERNRLMLARLFAQPANLLVMDEPTNDLDVETLEILEELLLDYEGTLLLVSHDRAFLNNIVTSTLALDGSGRVIETVGGYDDWAKQNESAPIESKPRKAAVGLENEARSSSSKKPSYKEQRAIEAQKRELAELPQRIEKLEADLHALTAEMATPNFYQRDSSEIAQTAERLKQMQDELNQAYARWEELET